MYPQSRAFWITQINYVETQRDQEWCLGFVTTAAIRAMSDNSSIRTANMVATYGLAASQGFSWSQVQDYCSRYGIAFSGAYNGTISADIVYREVGSWNFMLGCYSASNMYHALLLHGVDGSKVWVWNPWYSTSEWITNINTYNTSDYSWKMYGYGYYRI